jgi:hypothetical protein
MVQCGAIVPLERVSPGTVYVRIRSLGRAFTDFTQWHHSSYSAFCSNLGDYWTNAKMGRCWNAEAIHGMAADLSAVWNDFAWNLDEEIQFVKTAAIRTYAKLKSAALIAADKSGSMDDMTPVMCTFASNISHREHLLRDGIDRAIETFKADLDSLRTDTLSSAKSAFIGRLMENTYHAANMEYGKPALSST